jgi:hypothetical protein
MEPEITTIPNDNRVPVKWLNYPGRTSNILTEGIEQDGKGPTDSGERLYPVQVEYDPDTDTSRVGFSYVRTPEHLIPAGADQ